MKPLVAAVSLLLAFGCASPAEKGDETALRTQEADRGAYALPQQANPGDYPDLRPTTTERPKPRVSRSAPRTTVARPKLPASGDVWARLAMCESGMRPTAHSSTGRYHGAFQFSLATWHSLGYSGDPHTYPYAVQLEAAQRLQRRSGWGQWPACAKKLGLI